MLPRRRAPPSAPPGPVSTWRCGPRGCDSADDARVFRLWEWQRLLRWLREASSACLGPEERGRYLAETPEQAQRAFERCERAQGR